MNRIACLLLLLWGGLSQTSVAQSGENITVNVNVDDGVKTTEVLVSKDGTKERFKWTGDEMPEEVVERLKELNLKTDILTKEMDDGEVIEMTVTKDSSAKEKVKESAKEREIVIEKQEEKKQKIHIKKDDEEQVIEWTGDEMPDEVKELLKEHNMEMDDEEIEHLKTKSPRPSVYLGIAMAISMEKTMQNREEISMHSVSIEEVVEGSPASKAGLQAGDVIKEIDGMAVEKANSINEILLSKKPGDKVTMMVERDGADLEIPVTLAPARSTEKRIIKKEIIREKHQ